MIRTLTRALGAILTIVYAIYAWIVFLFSVLLAILSALLLPGLIRRRRWVAVAARLFFRLAFIPTSVTGMERLPGAPCIVVANHASYIDGIVLQAFLPPRFGFVIKGEVQRVPVLHFVLRRIGAKFVERYVHSASARDARNLVKAASAGESLGVFPEGTFSGEVGLARFRQGAFAAAVKAGIPLVPAVIRGSRGILPSGTLLARPGRLEFELLAPILPQDAAFATPKALSQAARTSMLAKLGEPDLAGDAALVP